MSADFWAVDPMETLHRDIKSMVLDRYNATPRHQQRELGPSQIGHPCARHLASAILDLPGPNPPYDPLPSIVGTASHTWFESAATLANTNLGHDRWLTETKVWPAEWIHGSCDLYDTETETVVDLKFPGVNQFAILKKKISQTYRVQVHLYGKGFENLGRAVANVAIALIPRGGTLASSVLWHEAYDRRIADAALDRYERIRRLTETLDIRANPEMIQAFEKVGYNCVFCRWFSPRPEGPTECEGVDAGIHP